MDVCSIILSAGKGTRMLSSIPKPLHLISGKTMLQWVIDANKSAGIKKTIMVIPQEFNKLDLKSYDMDTVIQKKTNGNRGCYKKSNSFTK